MNMERERGRPFFACIFTRRKQREIISILPAGVFEEAEKWCSPLSLSLSLEGRLLPSNEILLSFASFCHPSTPSLFPHSTPFTARQGYPIPHSSHLLYPLACEISPSKANLLPLLLNGDLPCEVASTQFPNCRFHTFFPPLSLSLSMYRKLSFKLVKLKIIWFSWIQEKETLEAEDASFQ